VLYAHYLLGRRRNRLHEGVLMLWRKIRDVWRMVWWILGDLLDAILHPRSR